MGMMPSLPYSAPRHRHRPGDGAGVAAAINMKIVAGWCACDRLADGGEHPRVLIGVRGQRTPHVRGVLLQTDVELARTGRPHATAAFAETMGERRNETDSRPISSTLT